MQLPVEVGLCTLHDSLVLHFEVKKHRIADYSAPALQLALAVLAVVVVFVVAHVALAPAVSLHPDHKVFDNTHHYVVPKLKNLYSDYFPKL